ncbi:MAG: hypothetical protein J5497_03925 [Selenomonadaceae bacterium]|nr:hypothetical protein [Selenomonadaceae bacterium]
MLRKILAVISLVGLITMSLLTYSATTSVSEMEQGANSYKQQLKLKAKEVAAPILAKFGVDIEKVEIEDINIVKQKIEDASEAMEDASRKVSQ